MVGAGTEGLEGIAGGGNPYYHRHFFFRQVIHEYIRIKKLLKIGK